MRPYEKAVETRRLLGPRYPRSSEVARVQPEWRGTSARGVGRAPRLGRAHPVKDAP